MEDKINVKGKKYIVTGASSGIGKSVAICLSECGAVIVLVGRNIESLEDTRGRLKGDGHICVTCDLSETDSIKSIFEHSMSDGLKISGLVHSAGIAPVIPLQNLDKTIITECMNVNFYSFIELVRLLSKKKYRADKVSIVEISSINSLYPDKCQTIYAASKAAANIAVQALALELSGKGIRINSLLPGSVNTPMTEKALKNMAEDVIQKKINKQLLGISAPDEIADEVLFLLSDMSSAVTGRMLYADGGYINF